MPFFVLFTSYAFLESPHHDDKPSFPSSLRGALCCSVDDESGTSPIKFVNTVRIPEANRRGTRLGGNPPPDERQPVNAVSTLELDPSGNGLNLTVDSGPTPWSLFRLGGGV